MVAQDSNGNSEVPDMFLPLHHEEVRRATGIVADTLKRALKHRADQYSPDAYQIIVMGDRTIYRFNPARHLAALEEKKKQWLEKAKDGQSSGADKRLGSPGPTGKAAKSASASAAKQAPASTVRRQRATSTGPQQQPTKSGAALLRRLMEQERQKQP
jgi:hypothetical protein